MADDPHQDDQPRNIVREPADQAERPDGERIYANRTVLLARTRWGRIVEQEDFYEDTGRILALEERLRELGVEPVLG